MSAVYEDEIIIPVTAYTTTFQSRDFRALGAAGLYITLHVASVTSGNAALRLYGKEPFEGTYYLLNVDVTVTTAVRHVWVFAPGVARTPDGEAASTLDNGVRQTVGIWVPDTMRIEVAKSDASSWTYGVAVRRIPA